MEHCKLQICCLFILAFLAFNYYREGRQTNKKCKMTMFDVVLIVSSVSLIFDGMTAYTVNSLESVPGWFNMLAHLMFLLSIDSVIFVFYIYMLVMTESFPQKLSWVLLICAPFIVNILIVVFSIGKLEYRIGNITNYSMGVPVYTCYVMVVVYTVLTFVTFIRRWNYIERHKRTSITLYMLIFSVFMVYQMFVPEALTTSMAITMLVVGVYLNQENPSIKKLSQYHKEMIMGFATLVESKDDNTGGHIRRTSLYAELLAKELRDRGYYKNILTKDYIRNLCLASPMHDIGKISIPDVVLQKPGKLTDEEYAIMKTHSEVGGRIIKETFGKLDDEEYKQMAYEMANYHHEKWNGKGYPTGLSKTDIPLCARIMAVADVFDAVSQKRCYRDAMPLDKCFDIIKEGSGRDFEPLLAEVFLDIRDKVEEVYNHVQ